MATSSISWPSLDKLADAGSGLGGVREFRLAKAKTFDRRLLCCSELRILELIGCIPLDGTLPLLSEGDGTAPLAGEAKSASVLAEGAAELGNQPLLRDLGLSLPQLQRLDLSQNNLRELPPAFFSRLTQLQHLHLQENKLNELPNSLLFCAQLQSLFVGHNQLQQLPPSLLDHCRQLAHLSCERNELTTLPEASDFQAESIEKNGYLRDLSCSYNQLTRIPVHGYEALQKCDVCHNQLTDFPGAIAEKLKELNLSENPLSDKKLQKLASAGMLKPILTHLRGGVSKTKKKQREREEEQSAERAEEAASAIARFLLVPETLEAHMSKDFQILRPHWVGVVVRNVRFGSDRALQHFLQLQLQLMGNRRQLGIGSHFLPVGEVSGASPASDNDVARGLTSNSGTSAIFPLQLRTQDALKCCFQPLFFEGANTVAELLAGEWKQDAHKWQYARTLDPQRIPVLGTASLSRISDEETFPAAELLSVYPVSNAHRTACSVEQEPRDCLLEVSSTSSRTAAEEALGTLLIELLPYAVDIGDAGSQDTACPGGSDAQEAIPNSVKSESSARRVRCLQRINVLDHRKHSVLGPDREPFPTLDFLHRTFYC